MRKHFSRSSRTQPLIALAQAAAAQGATNPETLSVAEERLANRVNRLVTAGSDRSILDALAWLDDQHAHDAADTLFFWAEDAADTTEISLENKHLGLRKEPGQATTFLLPCILFAPQDHPIPLTIPDPDVFHQLTKSFRAHALINANPTLVLLPHLFRLADLPTTWSRRRQWRRTIVANAYGFGSTTSPSIISTPEPEPRDPIGDETPALHLSLRFLVGVVVSNGTDTDLPIWDESDPDSETREDQWNAWEETVQDLLTDGLGIPEVIAGRPEIWTHALHDGVSGWNQTVLIVSLEAFCQQSQGAPDKITADIRWNASQSAWRVVYATLDHLGLPVFWMVLDNPDQQRDDLMDALRAAGVRKMSIDERDRDDR